MEVDAENCEDIKPDIKPNLDMLNIFPEEPLLGSVTTFSNVEGPEVKGQQIRSSARVFKKMKLDSTVPLVAEKREKKEDHKQDIKRCYRPLWTSDDKSIFFEALNEFGKDFESIQMYISTKLKKKGVPEHLIKTKDQVRHLYYRSWHKISKYVKFAEGIKKVVQELYGLINYGELRKKIGSVSEKSLLKLNELIYKGSTVIRLKGKGIRVKTPMCRALRRINQLDEKYDEIKLPNRIIVELRPKDMTSFLKVQSIAQNPRIRTTLPLQKRLSSLIACVNKRWKTVDAKVYDKAVVSASVVTDSCVPPNSISEENKAILTPALRLTPPIDCRIEAPSINLSEYFTRQSICLISYEHRIGITNTNYTSFYNYHNYKNSKKSYRSRTDSISDKSEKSPQKTSSHTEDNDTCDMTDNEPGSEVNKVVDDVVNNILSLQQPKTHETDYETVKVKLEKKESDALHEQKQALINNIRRGWTEKESESLTLGEIYLMCGSDSKLVLDYAWDSKVKEEHPQEMENVNSYETNGDISDDNSRDLDLSASLSKLLSLKRAMESKIRKILTDIDKCADETDDKITCEENVFESEPTFVTPVYMQPNMNYFHTPSTPMIHLVSQIDSLQRLKPRYCNRRGRRPRSKQVVVERKLPLLPNKMESGHQIVRMNIISQDESTSEPPMFDSKNVITTDNHNMFINQDSHNASSPVFPEESHCSSDIIAKSLSNSDVGLELAGEDTMISNAPSSPSRILKESDNQWINSEVADYSLSSLLGHLESPMKANSTANLTNDDSRLSQDVDAQLQSLLTESSVDFSANFADLAAQVTNEIKN
ncbi:hypothetical protein NQ318_000339 [Aromia moschata]|uniref:SANT domain-containing protein n=1 Tax=Aromia moschata TaxID=1265417 RepID=A0AAV8XX70_9CUCU|nr:hypothetical protein NQ318_000339 [Aromia moschata]